MTDSSNGTRAYELVCTDCAFTAVVEDDIDGVYDAIEAHRDEMQSSPKNHTVDFEAISE